MIFIFTHVTMRWLILAGCCGLAFVHVSVAQNNGQLIIQSPRFYGGKVGSFVEIYCHPAKGTQFDTFKWYWAAKHDRTKEPLPGKKKHIRIGGKFLHIQKARMEDSGLYFCKINDTFGPGTGIQIARNISRTEALFRTKMKDGLIILQGLLLAVCIAAMLLRRRELVEKKDSIYEEPETDHIYEGLAIETCGGGLYEELSVYAQADGAEAPWE